MKKNMICALLLGACATLNAQVRVMEPEFIGSYYILTSDSTFAELPKENGTLKEHQNKVSRWSKITSGVSRVAGAAGIVGMGTAGSMSGVITGVRVATTAGGIGDAASTVGFLAGASGMDVVFQGNASTYTTTLDNGDLKFIIKAGNNEYNPADLYRIVRFKTTKKERRIQWMEFSSSLLGTAETSKKGYIGFTAHKYGEQSYLLTVPAQSLDSGQYGIFYMDTATATAIPVGTFGIQ